MLVAISLTSLQVTKEPSSSVKFVKPTTKVSFTGFQSRNPADLDSPHLDTASTSTITRSKPSAFPSALRAKRSAVQTLTEEDTQTTAKIGMTCDVCGREEMRWYTRQLRSADEGTTVFYVCDCGHK